MKNFWRKRARKILPSLIIVTLLIVALCNCVLGKRFRFIDIILSCIGLSNTVNPVTWYIGLMWCCYFMYWICKRVNIQPEFPIGVSILLLSVIFGKTPINMWGLNSFSFSAGVLCATYKTSKRERTNKDLIISAGLFVISFVFYYFILGNSNVLIIRNPCKSIIAILFLNCFFAIFERCYTPRIKIIQRAGVLSYEAFMIHAIFIWYFPEIFSMAPFFISMIGFIALNWILSELVHKLGTTFEQVLNRRNYL